MTRSLRLVERPLEMPAFERFYREHFELVWRSLARLGVPSADLPDAVQDVFVIASRRYHELDFATRVSTWLYAVCLRVASDRRRKVMRRRSLIAEEPLVDVRTAREAGDMERLLEHALDALSNEQRAVFTLFELDGHTGEQIAELLDLPLGTVFSRLRSARHKFRAALLGDADHEGESA
jgi:RNA polymerase sigma-70 factor, ECF subfamily